MIFLEFTIAMIIGFNFIFKKYFFKIKPAPGNEVRPHFLFNRHCNFILRE